VTVSAKTTCCGSQPRPRGSEHPLARAIVDGARDRGIDVSDPDDFENVPGHGIRATVGDSEVLVGNRKFLRDNGIDPSPAQETMERLENEGKTAMLVARVPAGTDEGELVGVVADADTVKESAKEDAVSQLLQERGVDVMMITGDNERTARAVAEQVGIDPRMSTLRCSPRTSLMPSRPSRMKAARQ